MRSDPERAVLWQKFGGDEFSYPGFERLKNRFPLVGALVVPEVEFGCEMEEPCPAVWLLELLVFVEIRDLLADVFRGEPRLDALDDLRFGGVVVKQSWLPDEAPVAMD